MFSLDLRAYSGEMKRISAVFDIYLKLNDLIETYSHGMRQKLALTGIFFRKPKAVFLDEPLVGLDPKSAKALKQMIVELSREGTTFFISTHSLEIAENLANTIGIIKSGRIALFDTKDNVLSRKDKDKSLEDIFLEITGDLDAREIAKNL